MGQRAIQVKTGWTVYVTENLMPSRPKIAKEAVMHLVKRERRHASTWSRNPLWTARVYAALPILFTVYLVLQAREMPLEKILGVQFLGGALLSLLV